eukprot:scaffold23961_cov131-Isochrysis_galbana.AAC.10
MPPESAPMDCRGVSPVFAERPPCIRPLSSTRRAPGCPFVGPRRALSFGSSREFSSKIGTPSLVEQRRRIPPVARATSRRGSPATTKPDSRPFSGSPPF